MNKILLNRILLLKCCITYNKINCINYIYKMNRIIMNFFIPKFFLIITKICRKMYFFIKDIRNVRVSYFVLVFTFSILFFLKCRKLSLLTHPKNNFLRKLLPLKNVSLSAAQKQEVCLKKNHHLS